MAELRVQLPIPEAIFNQIKVCLRSRYRTAARDVEAYVWMQRKAPRVRAWIPWTVIQTVYPQLVADFTGNLIGKSLVLYYIL